jgi:hypothetical protein
MKNYPSKLLRDDTILTRVVHPDDHTKRAGDLYDQRQTSSIVLKKRKSNRS